MRNEHIKRAIRQIEAVQTGKADIDKLADAAMNLDLAVDELGAAESKDFPYEQQTVTAMPETCVGCGGKVEKHETSGYMLCKSCGCSYGKCKIESKPERFCRIERGMDDYSFRFCKADDPPSECRNCLEHKSNSRKLDPTDFTKVIRKAIHRYNIGQVDFADDWVKTELEEACDIIKSLQAKNDELEFIISERAAQGMKEMGFEESKREPMEFTKEFENVVKKFIKGDAGKYLVTDYSRTACAIIESQAEQLKEVEAELSSAKAQIRRGVEVDTALRIERAEQLAAAKKELERLRKGKDITIQSLKEQLTAAKQEIKSSDEDCRKCPEAKKEEIEQLKAELKYCQGLLNVESKT